MKIGLRSVLPSTILGRTILLAAGMVLLLTAINLGIIFLRPPPRSLPLSSYELARVIEGKPIATLANDVRRVSSGRNVFPNDQTDRLIGIAIAQHLHVPLNNVGFRRASPMGDLKFLDRRIAAEYRLYSPEAFDPLILGNFQVVARLSNGTVRSFERNIGDAGWSWQLHTASRLFLAFLLVLPIAWLFARQLARPIKAFASAADRVGREPGVAPVDVSGPAEIRLAAQAVNEMQNRLHRYIAERTSVVGAIAHDFRTPLARMRFHLASAPKPIRTKVESEIAEMQAMITATLDFVQHETRAKVSDLIDLPLLIESLADDYSDLGRTVEIERLSSSTVRGDPLLLKRLFGNLLSNALNYGKSARVAVSLDRGNAVVTISDDGPGLADQDIARAFEPFYRAEASRNRDTGGMGLGLAIVKGAARAHGGDVQLSNGPERGLIARVTLPLA